MKYEHRLTKWGMDEALGALQAHLDELGSEGWEPFHMHELILSGRPTIMVFSRRTRPKEP